MAPLLTAAKTVGNISALNSFLGGQDPTYGIGLGGDSELFELDGTSLKLKTIPNHLMKESYTVNITSTGTFGTNNFRIFDIAVSEGAAMYADFITEDDTAGRDCNHPGREIYGSIRCRLGRWNRNKRHRGCIALC